MTDDVSETRKIPRGRVQFDMQDNGRALDVRLDRAGFRRLLETLERLAETGERQAFEKSGRARPGSRNGAANRESAVVSLIFHIDGQS
ncbi:MAG: hypothetical protein R3F54_13420 [Alphaproteobacteria bacterium]